MIKKPKTAAQKNAHHLAMITKRHAARMKAGLKESRPEDYELKGSAKDAIKTKARQAIEDLMDARRLAKELEP